MDPANPDILYAGTANTSSSNDGGAVIGVLKSTDAGAHWSAIGGTALKDLGVNSIIVFHGTSENLLIATTGGLYTMGLDGLAPTKVTAGLSDGVITDLIRQAAGSDTVFAAVAGKGVYTSTNRGVAWTPSWPLPLSERIRFAVGSDGTLYVAEIGNACQSRSRCCGRWKSTDA
jgi:photosystem II stability/assembly factor-like uncharacterized protein